jgi:hypothetical protein
VCATDVRYAPSSGTIRIAPLWISADQMDILARLDDLFEHRTPSGNVWLAFEGFDPASATDEVFMTRAYYRGNFAIYPRRVYVAAPSTVVNNAQPMVHDDDPLATFAHDLDIHWRVTFARRDDEPMTVHIQRMP